MEFTNAKEEEKKHPLNDSQLAGKDSGPSDRQINIDDLDTQVFNSIVMDTLNMGIGPDDYADIEWPVFMDSEDESGQRETMFDILPEMAIIMENECIN